jgi:arabinan endo-1,5-alpha-L-arabinosidase
VRTRLGFLFCLCACAADEPNEVEPSSGGKSDGPAAFTWANPIIAQEAGGVADPGVVKAQDGHYYMASTGGSAGLYPIRVSDDLVHWKHVGYIFPNGSKPGWIMSHPWAPEIHYVAGRYLAFYTALPQGATLLALGVAVADSPLGPWTDRGILKGIPQGEPILVDSPGAIDSHYFKDPLDGRHYMIWKHERNSLPPYGTPLFIQELAPDGLSLLGTRKELIRNDLPWEENLVEGPWMTFRGGYYYLFYSGSAYYDHRYATGVARSKQANVPLATQLATFAPPRLDKRGLPILSSTAADCWQGPGHGSIIKGSDGADYYVYHAWEKNHVGGGNARLGMLDRVTWSNGWPTINNGKPSLGNCDGL